MVCRMRNIRLDIREGWFCASLLKTVRKSLILHGEMLERSIRHAWKLIPAAHRNAQEHTSNHLPPSTSLNNDLLQYASLNDHM